MTCLQVTQKSNSSNFNSDYNNDPLCQNPQKKTAMLRFLTTIKVITTKQRNKFKNNNREGGDKRGEKAPFPSGAHKQQEPVSLWQHLQTFLLLSQKYLMLMLQCDASAAVLSQRTVDLASSWLPKRKNILLTDCVWHLSWQEYSERRKEKWSERWEGKRKMEEWQRVIDVWNCMCEKNNSAFSGFVAIFFFFTIRRTEGGFLLLSRCVESSGSRTKWFTENGIFYIGVSNSARRPCGGILFVCFYWSLHWACPKALTGGPRGRLSSPPNHKMERRSSLCALNYTPQHTLSHTGSQPCPPHPKNKTEAEKKSLQ